MATEKQEHYINALLSEYESVEDDQKYYEDYMKQVGKNSIKELSTQEASRLIQGLIRIKVPLTMLCGKVVMVEKDEIMGGKVMGRLEECLHNCDIDVYDCQYWVNEK